MERSKTASPENSPLRRLSSRDRHFGSYKDQVQDRIFLERRSSREEWKDRDVRGRSIQKERNRSRSNERSGTIDRIDIKTGGNRNGRNSRSRSASHNRHSKNEVVSRSSNRKIDTKSERDLILSKWRENYCKTEQQLSEKLEELAALSIDDFRKRKNYMDKLVRATTKLKHLCELFNDTLVLRARKIRSLKPTYEPPPRKNRARLCKHKTEASSSDSSDDSLTDEEDCTMEELQRKQQHPERLHPEMWYNEPGEMNDGPLCRCSWKCKKSGIRHGIYPGEKHLNRCSLLTNNADRLFHYRITISPPTNFLIKTPTIIQHDEHEFIFEGFSMFSHFPLEKLPSCRVIRFNIEYTILYIEEKIPENFTVWELDLFNEYVFQELLELVDLDFKAASDEHGCPQFHFMPRFVRELPENGKEILCMKEVLQYLINSSVPLIEQSELQNMMKMSQFEWQSYADEIKGMVVTYPGKKPCSVRVDQLDRNKEQQNEKDYEFPEIVHFGIRPPQLSYAGNPEYQKAWRDYVKFRHLLANMSKPTYEDKRKLEAKENKLLEMRTQGKMKRDVTVAVSSEGFYRTGIMCDIIQHIMLIPVLVCHLRFHRSLNVLEEVIDYKFSNRALLQLALTHPSYRENFGTNPDHARNSLTNCGIRQPEYGDRRIHYMNTRKRGDHSQSIEDYSFC
ncbi:hypothetical protein JTB14_004906 [Gonioctena quinquepunctata]|nr:hypothetical protein JTB14_004906 [Gonioctena quinquepunctata]